MTQRLLLLRSQARRILAALFWIIFVVWWRDPLEAYGPRTSAP
jgi:hypothetical protein